MLYSEEKSRSRKAGFIPRSRKGITSLLVVECSLVAQIATTLATKQALEEVFPLFCEALLILVIQTAHNHYVKRIILGTVQSP